MDRQTALSLGVRDEKILQTTHTIYQSP